MTYPVIESVWLIGSRANNRETQNSDWDLLVFGNRYVIEELKNNSSFNYPDVDLLVVYDGDRFEAPWINEDKKKKQKKGSLTAWGWVLESPSSATYEGWSKPYLKKGVNRWDAIDSKAIRLWPK